ncbi:hypothetical protein SAMN02745866_00674 [Alteromonadaceae bacterium Bs31]|nr:hypothetical protein SAMN02745866_00674 [Alteromonadaceae bacterium Bs31]
MNKSLQDQLLGAGLVDKKKAKAIAKENRKAAKQKRGAPDLEKEQALRQAQEEKRLRDRELNRQIKEEQEKKAVLAQIKQLVERHRITDRTGELEYNFKDGSTIKKLLLNKKLHDQVSYGSLSIVSSGESYQLVPRIVAEKIREREASYVLVDNYKRTDSNVPDENDPYADYVIPDDLMW